MSHKWCIIMTSAIMGSIDGITGLMAKAVRKWQRQQSTQRKEHNTMLKYRSLSEAVQLPARLQPSSQLLCSHPLMSRHIQHLHPPSINASRLPSTQPYSIVCSSILLSLPWCPSLHREEAAFPLPSLLVRTIHGWPLTLVSTSLSLSLKPRLHEAARLLGFLMQSLVLLDCRGTKFKASDYDTHLKYDREKKDFWGSMCKL